MKRILSLIIAVILCLYASVVFADGAQISGADLSADSGASVDFPIEISGNTGVVAFRLEVLWDKATLSLGDKAVKYGEGFKNATVAENKKTDGELYIAWIQTTNVTQNGELVTLNFDVSKDAWSGEYPIEIKVSGFTNEDGVKTEPVCKNGSIKISGLEKEENDNSAPTKSGGTSIRPSGIPTAPEDTGKEEIKKADISFEDIEKDAYYYDAVLWAVENGITTGVSAISFSPDSLCNRAQAVTFLWRNAGTPEASKTNPFADVDADAYYKDAVLWAVKEGITNGVSETEFAPDETVSRAQLVTLLWRAAGKPAANESAVFSDVNSGSILSRCNFVGG